MPLQTSSTGWRERVMVVKVMVLMARCTRSTKFPTSESGLSSEQFLQQLSIVAAVLLGATLDQVIAAEWAGEGNSTYMGRAH